MITRRSFCFFIFLGFTTAQISAQFFSFRTYTTKDGLPSNQINCLYQDVRGFLWLGTNNGLSVFDGASFKNYSVVDGLSNGWISSICESRKEPGTIWIGTIAGGANRLWNGKFTAFYPGSTNDSNNVDILGVDTSDVVWGANDFGIFRIVKEKLSYFKIFPRGAVPHVAVVDSVIMLPVNDALEIFSTSGQCLYTIPLGIEKGAFVLFMIKSKSNDIFIIDSKQKITRLHNEKILSQRTISDTRMLDFGIDKYGNLWYITILEEYIELSANDLSTISRTAASSSEVYGNRRIIFDRENNLWVGTVGRGLKQCRNQQSYTFPNELLTTVVADNAGHVWTGSRNEENRALHEIFRDSNRRWIIREHRLPIMKPGTCTYPIMFDSYKRLWIYYWFSKTHLEIRSYDLLTRTNHSPKLKLRLRLKPGVNFPSEGIVGFLLDHKNRLWLGSDTCLNVLDANNGHRLMKYSWQEHRARADHLFEDHKHTIWIGTFADGLYFMKDGSEMISKVDVSNALRSDGIRSFYEDELGRLWIGTRYHGLFVRDGSIYTNVTMHDGLLSNAIWRIIPIDSEIVNLMTDVGIERIQKKNLRLLPTKSEWLFDAVPGNDKIPDGMPWYSSGTQGLTILDRPTQSQRRDSPPVYITELGVNGTATNLQDEHEFSSDKNNLTFSFIGISFRDEKSVRYKYRMIGISDAWSETTTPRSVTFAAMHPGTYSFEVIAINSEGIESVTPASLAFTILSPFWRTWWFVALVAAFIFLSLVSLYRYRMKRILELERMRTRIASDLHDDVGTNLSSITIASQIAERKLVSPEESKSLLEDIRSTAQHSQEMLRDIVWMLDPKNDTLDDFILKLKEVAGKFLSDILYTIHVEGEELNAKMGMEFKRNVLLIFKEALNNIRKHADATHVTILIRNMSGEFQLSIQDDGRGISNEPTTGSGIVNMHRRAIALGAKLTIRSVDQSGTILQLTLRIT